MDMTEQTIDWDALRFAATLAMRQAYAPYSNFKVGAAALTDKGMIVHGCNVENASYGLTLCAECNMLGSLFAHGGGKLVAFLCLNSDEEIIMPCGRCRQLLHEHAAEGMLIETPKGIATMNDILPLAFGKEDM